MGKLELLLTLLLFKQICGAIWLEPTGQSYNIPWSMMIFQVDCCCRWTLQGDWLHWPFSLTVWVGSLADFLFRWEIWITRWTCCKLRRLLSLTLPFNILGWSSLPSPWPSAVLLMLLYSGVIPPYSSADEAYHLVTCFGIESQGKIIYYSLKHLDLIIQT